MPYRHCQFIMEDGHRCNRTFGVRTNTSQRKLCPEHESKRVRPASSPVRITGKQENMRKFVDELYSFKWEQLEKKITKLFDYNRITNEKMDKIKQKQDVLDSNFNMMRDLNSKITESLYDKGPEYHDKIQRQLLKLNNELIKIRSDLDEMQ